MPSNKTKQKRQIRLQIPRGVPTPWDVVNIFGYCIGVEQRVLTYGVRNNSAFNYNYCSSVSTLRSLRNACLLRQVVIECYEELERNWGSDKKPCLPKRVSDSVTRLFRSKASLAKDLPELMDLIQSRIIRLLPEFQEILPEWFPLTQELSYQFLLSWNENVETLGVWCERTAKELKGRVYLHDYTIFSSRVLLDDRDLVEELLEICGHPVLQVDFPYARNKSNRTAHLERLQEFCNAHAPVTVEIDTENVESSLGLAFVKSLEEAAPNTIAAVNVYLSGMEGRPWRHLSEFLQVPVVYKEVPRVSHQKSVVDTAIIASVIKSKFEGKTNGVLLISSDCDFLVLHEQLPDYPVCFCCTRKQSSPGTLKYLRDHGLPSVYLDYVVNNRMSERMGQEYVMQHVTQAIENCLPNLKDVASSAFMEVCTQAGINSYSSMLDDILGTLELGVKMDGKVTATIKEESVE